MKTRLTILVENIAESSAACLITMVQGNLLALTLGHWLVASQTGALAGVVTAAAIVLTRTKRRWVISAGLGLVTAVVDYNVHVGQFGPAAMEAVVTGLGAAVLSYAAGTVARRFRRKTSLSTANLIS